MQTKRIWMAALALSVAAGTMTAQADEQQESHGKEVYSMYCVLCHGPKADGKGKGAASLGDVRPSNLRISKLNDAQKERIVKFGGESVGRSAKMPPWGQALSADEVRDLMAYLKTLHGSADDGT